MIPLINQGDNRREQWLRQFFPSEPLPNTALVRLLPFDRARKIVSNHKYRHVMILANQITCCGYKLHMSKLDTSLFQCFTPSTFLKALTILQMPAGHPPSTITIIRMPLVRQYFTILSHDRCYADFDLRSFHKHMIIAIWKETRKYTPHKVNNRPS